MPENCLEWQNRLAQVNQQLREAQAKIAELEALNQGIPQANPSLQALQSATDRYFQKIIDRSSDHIVLTDAATNILYSNSVVQILGYSVEEYIAIGIRALLHPGEIAKAEAFWRSVLESPNETKIEVLHARHKAGHYVWVEVSSVNLLHDPELGVVISNTRDVTERRRTEEALQESETFFRNTFEQAAVGMSHLALDGTWLRVNQRLCEIVGYSKEELRTKTFQDLTHPDDLEADLAQSRRTIAGEIQSYAMHKRYFHKSGKIVWINLTVALARNSIGEPDHFVVVVEDITQLKQTELALQQSEKRYRQIVEAQDDAICRYGPDFQLTFTNQYYAQLIYKKQPEEIIGRNLLERVPPEFRQTIIDVTNSLTPENCSLRNETPFPGADNKVRWIEWNHRALFDEQGEALEYQVVGRETTKRREIEEIEREQRRVAEALHDSLAALTTSLDVEEIMRQILASAVTVVPSDAASILLFEGESVRVAYTHGIPPENDAFLKSYRFSIHEPQFQELLSTRQPIAVRDTELDPDWIVVPVNDWIRATVGVPIVIRNEIIGALFVDSKIANHFQAKDVDILQSFSRHASLALEHAYYVDRLEERVKERTAELEAYATEIHDLYNNAPCGYYSLNSNGHFSRINDTALKWLGYSREEAVGVLKYSDLCTPESQEKFTNSFPLLKEHGWISNIEQDLIRKDGTIIRLLMNATAIYNEQGEYVGDRTMLYDITELKQTQETVRNQRDVLQLVIDAVPTAIVLKGEDGRYEMANKRSAGLYNLTPEQMVGKSDAEVHANADDVAYFAWQDDQVRKTGKALFIPNAGFDGYHFQTHVIPLKNNFGKVNRILVVSNDITEQKRIASALSEQRDFLDLIINSVPDLIMVKDLEGRFQMANMQAARIYGLTPQEMIGKSDSELNPNSEEVAFYLSKDREALSIGNTVFIPEERILDRFYQTSKIPLRNSEGVNTRLLVVASDITEHRQAAALLEQALQKEKEVSELRSRFISMTSHEFRTPLTAILATAETLRVYRNKLTDEQIDKRFGKIVDQVNYLKDIMEDVLQLSRLQTRRSELNFSEFDLNLLCRQLIDELRSEFVVPHQIVYTFDESLQTVHLDKKLMRQAISNLLSNAVKYSPAGKPITLTVAQESGTILLEVRDQGIGIPEADIKHLFEPFHRATNVGTITGTGLGLAIAKESVQLHGGELSVESKIDVGTAFTIRIPLKR